MKVLITGADGQLAREFIRTLGIRGDVIIALGKRELDITADKAVTDALLGYRPEVVINCAAYNDVDGAESDWRTSFLVNGSAIKNLSSSCNVIGATLVHFSSDYVFDGLKAEPYEISDRPNPVNKYGESKLLGEQMLKDHSERYFLIRTSWVFGDGKHSFPKKLSEWSSKSRTLRIVDDQVSSPSYAADIAAATMDLVEKKTYGLHHIANSGFCSRYEWAKFILQAMKWDGELLPARSEDFKTPAKRPKFSALDSCLLKETIGYALPSWEDATQRFLQSSLMP